jgi:hypothetical protein
MLEQLLCAGAGFSGLQVVAATARLLDPADPMQAAALQVCQTLPPESYGWLNDSGTRYVFHRCMPAGRPDVGAVHVIAGPPAELPAGEITRRYGSPWWWRGGPVGPHLLDPEDPTGRTARHPDLAEINPVPLITIAPADRVAMVRATLAAIGRGDVALRVIPPLAAALVAQLATDLPGVVDLLEWTTVGQNARRFDIFGVGPGRGAGPGSLVATSAPMGPEIEFAAQLIMSPDPRARHIVLDALARAGVSAPDASAEIIVRRLVAMICLGEELARTGTISIQSAVAFLADRRSAGAVLGMRNANGEQVVIGSVATALAAWRPEVWDVLATVADAVNPADLTAIGAYLWWRTGESADAITRLEERALRTAQPVADGLAAAILETPPEGLARLDRLGPRLRMAIIRSAAIKAKAEVGEFAAEIPMNKALDRLITGAPDTFRFTGRDQSVPASWRAAVLVEAARKSVSNHTWVAEAIAEDPNVTDFVAGRLAGDWNTTVAIIRSLPSRSVAAVAPRLAAPAGPAERGWVLSFVVERMPADQRMAFLHQHVDPADVVNWQHVISAEVTRCAINGASALRRGQEYHPSTAEVGVVRMLGGVAGQVWGPLICAFAGSYVPYLGNAPQAGPVPYAVAVEHNDVVAAMRSAPSLTLTEMVRTALLDLAVLVTADTGNHWGRLWEITAEAGRMVTAFEIATRLLNSATYRSPMAARRASMALPCVARLVQEQALAIASSGRMADGTLDELAQTATLQLFAAGVPAGFAEEIGAMGGHANRWWTHLARTVAEAANKPRRR